MQDTISTGIAEIIGSHPPGRQSLVSVLQDIQTRYGYLSEESVDELSRATEISENEIFGVATFYTQFRFTPPGDCNVRVCLGTACHVRGGAVLLSDVETHLGIKAGETSPDRTFELSRVACVGTCALAPAVVVDGEIHGRMTTKKIRNILSKQAEKAADAS